jgi:Tfp pilus assembly protein FimV
VTGRELSIFACLTDTVVAPVAPLPQVRDTDAAPAFARSLELVPALNALGLRAALLAVELAPLALGFGARLRRLAPADRERALDRIDRGPLAPLLKALRSMAHLHYYGDLGVMRLLGYDPEAVVARAELVR